jgi:hypothetical protein
VKDRVTMGTVPLVFFDRTNKTYPMVPKVNKQLKDRKGQYFST